MITQTLAKPVKRHRHDVSATNITTTAWVQTISSMDVPSSAVIIYNGTGRIIEIGIGPPGGEVPVKYYISPNEITPILPLNFSNGDSVSLRAVDGNATYSSIVINFFG